MRGLMAAAGHTKLVMLGLSMVAVTTLTAATMISMALFTDQKTDDSTFTTGTIILNSAGISAMNLTTTAMMPGDSVRSSVSVQNDGSAQLRYAVSQTSTNADTKDLRSSLLLVVRSADTGVGNTFAEDGDYCDDATGSVLRASAAIGASGNLIGNPAQGGHSGDRTLNAAASEVLCFYVSLDISAPNAMQGATTTTTFTFAAEQTANNT